MSPVSVSLSFILITPITSLMKSVPGRQIIICKVQGTVFICFGTPSVKDIRISSFTYIHDKRETQIFPIIIFLEIETVSTILGGSIYDGR